MKWLIVDETGPCDMCGAYTAVYDVYGDYVCFACMYTQDVAAIEEDEYAREP